MATNTLTSEPSHADKCRAAELRWRGAAPGLRRTGTPKGPQGVPGVLQAALVGGPVKLTGSSGRLDPTWTGRGYYGLPSGLRFAS